MSMVVLLSIGLVLIVVFGNICELNMADIKFLFLLFRYIVRDDFIFIISVLFGFCVE